MKPYGSMRTHGAGTLRAHHAGELVELAGWVARRRDHGGVAFLDLRDRSGVVQVVADPSSGEALAAAHDVRGEYVVRVAGQVRRRPPGMVNSNLDTGEVEVAAARLQILSTSEPVPFPIADGIEADETTRLAYRYLDLRRPSVARAITMRAHITRVIRRVLDAHDFTDIETPYLTRSTPEGARDFLVPVRLQPGTFYALPQSPQLFKQLFMVAGLERYYQIARCFRDEDLRADRQPEFTQLDIEASFVDEEDIFTLIEELIVELWRDVLGVELSTPIPRMTHDEALSRYGTDSPDLRFGLELVDLSDVFAATQVDVFSRALDADGAVVAVRLPGGGVLSRKQFDDWVTFARGRGAAGLGWAVVQTGEESGDADQLALRGPLAKFMSAEEVAAVCKTTGAEAGDALFFGAGATQQIREHMGGLRTALGRDFGLIPPDRWEFVWVTQWPMFEYHGDDARWDALHHPFTAPAPDWAERFDQTPAQAKARAYDLALNGVELGGGSIRIHRRDVQERVLELIGIEAAEAQERFGFLLQALAYGAPPHGGIAFGLDRIAMLMAGGQSLRDVIAFPKTASGTDPLTGAPARVDAGQLREVGLRTLEPAART